MTDKITVELSSKYIKQLELLKQIIPSSTGEEITDDAKMIETLIDSFISFIEEQASHHDHSNEGGCCGGWEKEEWQGWCGCSH